MTNPLIHLYAICWNEEPMLGFFFDHYDPYVDQYTFYDDGSTDGTLDLLAERPNVSVHSLPPVEDASYVLAAQRVHDNAWKASRGIADWVIISAVDEFLYHPRLIEYLTDCATQGVTALPCLGFQMMSDFFPDRGTRLVDEIRSGAAWANLNKLVAFRPEAVDETHYAVGRHTADPKGHIVYPETDEVLNLHYKYLSVDWVEKRNQALNIKLRLYDKSKHWGHKYAWDREQLLEDWRRFESRLIPDVIASRDLQHRQHSPLTDRWWRSAPAESPS